MAKDIHPPRGMRDFLPSDKAHRDEVLGRIVASYTQHGFTAIETPVMEDIARLTSGMGGDNEKLAFRVQKRGITAEALAQAADAGDAASLSDLGLRFDLTVPLSRFYASHAGELPAVFRSIQTAPVWRAERPQKGRYRQFVQCDIDIIGEQSALAEVELLAASVDTFAALGVDGVEFRINDRRILEGLLGAFGFASTHWPAVLISVDKLDKIGIDGVVADLAGDGIASRFPAAALDALRSFLADVEGAGLTALSRDGIEELVGARIADEAARAGVANLLSIAEAIGTLPGGPKLVFDPTLVRGMGYYTGTIFEASHPSSSSSVGGGGRYDGMIGRFLGRDVPACGFSIGFERIVDLVPRAGRGQGGVVLVYEPGTALPRLVALKQEFVSAGHRVRLERRPKRLGPVLDSLAELGFTRFGFVGEETLGGSDVELRDFGS